MVSVPLGADLNLALQVVAFVLILVGLRYAVLTHRANAQGKEGGKGPEAVHKNLMTTAVIISGVGSIVWMIPNFILGWYYGSSGLGYGTGGYTSYLSYSGVYLPQWFLIPIMVVLGVVTAVLGVYLVLRMRWAGFPRSLAVKNYRSVMILTWSLWFINVIVGLLVFYYFALPPQAG